MSELLPCPFCGGENTFIKPLWIRDFFSIVENCKLEAICPDCDILFTFSWCLPETPDTITEEKEEEYKNIAISKWNTRADRKTILRFARALKMACNELSDRTGECPNSLECEDSINVCDCENCDNETSLCWDVWFLEMAKRKEVGA